MIVTALSKETLYFFIFISGESTQTKLSVNSVDLSMFLAKRQKQFKGVTNYNN